MLTAYDPGHGLVGRDEASLESVGRVLGVFSFFHTHFFCLRALSGTFSVRVFRRGCDRVERLMTGCYASEGGGCTYHHCADGNPDRHGRKRSAHCFLCTRTSYLCCFPAVCFLSLLIHACYCGARCCLLSALHCDKLHFSRSLSSSWSHVHVKVLNRFENHLLTGRE